MTRLAPVPYPRRWVALLAIATAALAVSDCAGDEDPGRPTLPRTGVIYSVRDPYGSNPQLEDPDLLALGARFAFLERDDGIVTRVDLSSGAAIVAYRASRGWGRRRRAGRGRGRGAGALASRTA